MRLSPSYYPEYVDFTCEHCWTDHVNSPVTEIDADSVRLECWECGEPTYVRVIED